MGDSTAEQRDAREHAIATRRSRRVSMADWVAAIVAPAAATFLAERLLPWLVPSGVNYRLGRAIARLAMRLAPKRNEKNRAYEYAEDAVATIDFAHEALRKGHDVGVRPLRLALGVLYFALTQTAKEFSMALAVEIWLDACFIPADVLRWGECGSLGPISVATRRQRLSWGAISVSGASVCTGMAAYIAPPPVAAACSAASCLIAWIAWCVLCRTWFRGQARARSPSWEI
jgi:hypothetical protein